MKPGSVFLPALTLIAPALLAGNARAGCFPVKSEVVSLGEKAARFYAERSLVKAIDEQKGSVESSGNQLGSLLVTRPSKRSDAALRRGNRCPESDARRERSYCGSRGAQLV